MDWQQFFGGIILGRGHEYYLCDAVQILQRDKNTLTAIVSGAQSYRVKIYFRNEQVNSMYCSCPHADAGNNCKHMAAVLFAWENDEDNEYNDIKDSAVELVAEEVRQYLINLIEKDKKLYANFEKLIRPEALKGNVAKYQKRIDSIVKKHQGRDYFIDYYSMSEIVSGLCEILSEDVEMMIEHEYYLEALEVTNYIFETVGNIDMEDSADRVEVLAQQCYEIWLQILKNVDEDMKRIMFKWFIEALDGSIINELDDYIQQILLEEFMETEFLKAQLDFTDEKAKEAQSTISDIWYGNYEVGQWALKHLFLMEQNGDSDEDVEKYCRRYWDLTVIREYYIERCIAQKKYDRAIKVLKESQKLDVISERVIRGYGVKLKEVYRLSGKKKEYLEQLWKLVLNDERGDVETYRELKRQYSNEEWSIKRGKIFASQAFAQSMAVLYKEEKMYDKLWECVTKSSGIYMLQIYENVLKKGYSKEILQKYEREVQKMAKHTSSRQQYWNIVAILRSMEKVPGGKKLVREIVSNWQVKYKNRPAMMDELRKL